jgi:glycosyltransferase involved in cell wall biosynthesis
MSISTPPIVSVVIPTRNRPSLVVRAVETALAQTLTEIEVIVIIDGLDTETSAALAAIADPRLRTVSLSSPVGAAEARNIGVREACAQYIAFLDDDDEWLPHKLDAQLVIARRSSLRFPVIACRVIARRPQGDEIWPSRAIRYNEPMSEYLLCRDTSLRQGEGFAQTSTLFVPRDLLLWVPFQTGLPRHQDWDWIIRAAAYPGVKITWVWDTLTIYHIDAQRKSISIGSSLAPSIDWIRGNRHITPKARAFFYATQIAARCRSFKTFFQIVRETMPYPRAFLIAMGLALTPRSIVHLSRPKDIAPRSVPTHA